jgi:hypothetical protein
MSDKKPAAFIKKQPVALGCALFCLVLGVAAYFRSSSLADANNILADKKSEGEHLKENVNNSSKLDDQFAAMTQATQAIEARLVHVDQLAINLQYFYKIESESQAKLANLQQTTVSAKDSGKSAYTGVGYTISVQGTYPQVLDFLRRVENGDHFSRVIGLTLTQGGVSEAAGDAPVSLSLNLNLELLGLP